MSNDQGQCARNDPGSDLSPGNLVRKRATQRRQAHGDRLLRFSVHEGERKHELIPREDEHENSGGDERRSRKGQADLSVGLESGKPVYRSRLLQLKPQHLMKHSSE